ncbi:MAG: type I DNA topoisomerase [Cytophagaceae bacterium]
MSKNLVIVESPAKAKTIEGYLGKDFTVKSSYGHVRDLPKGDKAIDIKNGFTPTYEISEDKKDVVAELKKLAKASDIVWLATDDDREGEAISWHLKEALKLTDENTRRIVFREITKTAIVKAIETPRGIDIDLVNAQQARRILDRLVGFEISPLLWKKIKTGLSAGRVQSVAVRLIVEREREIEHFKSKASFKVTAIFETEKKSFNSELSEKFDTEEEAMAFLQKCIGAGYKVLSLEKKPAKRSPAPPFTTSTLQQEASRKLGFSVAQTMTVAQKLYEAGKISYMRTDSVNLSDFAIDAAKDEITKAYGADFVHTRKYKTKSESAQEAHEAIRPTDFAKHEVDGERNEQRLYELIWKRAIASQMSDAQLEKTVVSIGISSVPQTLTARGEVITFEGFLKVYIESDDDEEKDDEDKEGMLPAMTVGQALNLDQMKALERYSRPAARYTEAMLVKKLEELGIGRPSTYAPTISTIQKRGYVIKEQREGKERKIKELILSKDKIQTNVNTEITGAEKGKLYPTDIAMIVNDYLVQHFPNITDYSFTANVEKEFDDIAAGKKKWDAMISNFYGAFHDKVVATGTLERANTNRDLGIDPKSGKKLFVRLGRFGPIAQIGETVEGSDEKPQFASLRKGQFLESITYEEALELFKLPREIGLLEEQPMVVAIGRFGPYIRHDGKFYSIPKEDDPLEISDARGIEIILAKRKADAEKLIKSWDENPDVKVLNGRWGPYIAAGKKNVKIPKDRDPKSLTLEECLTLAENAPEKKGRFARKTTTPAATPVKAAKPAKAEKATKAKPAKTVKAKKKK